ncbi:MAG: threonine--tRNA ligase [Anaerolineales bacterium]|nr:threonine--tRNA ligase [Anaerolineales bacterium]
MAKQEQRYEESELYRIRHSTAHVMAQAVMEMFPEEAKIAIGPPIEDGFYYDFDLPRSLTPEDLDKIESRMREIIAGEHDFEKRVVSAEEARDMFADQPYKLELIEGLEEGEVDDMGEPVEEPPEISVYRQDEFVDLCRGPHVENTAKINPDAVKLMSIAGAYWRGDEDNPMLQRIYGTAWRTANELEEYLHMREEAKRRDHRRIGKQLNLFHFSEDVGPGLPLFTPKGEIVRHLMEAFVRDVQSEYGYEHVWTGHLVKEDLYHKSGHYDNYRESMFPPLEEENVAYRLKPMNCPSHMTLYKEMGQHSYRDLPLRMAEFATLYRYEKTGELTGLTRVRALTQDDCHIFCTEDQIEEEFALALQIIQEVLDRYRFSDYRVRLSLPDESGKYVRDEEKWDRAIAALRAAMDASGLDYVEDVGEAAFYGPKADFMARDVLGREWQLSTIQVDFIQPARLDLAYVGEDNEEHTPVVIHRAVTGSTERFLGVLIEHYAGAFPVWLSPVQAVLIPIADRHIGYAREVADQLEAADLRVEVDDSGDRMNAKIRDAQNQNIPYMLIVGDREEEAGTVSLRLRTEEDLGAMSVEDFLARAEQDIEKGV